MKTIFVDIDTQLDFLSPSGALYVPGAEHVIPAIARLNHYASEHGIPLISTMDAHAENDPEFRDWPAHCVAGTLGQRKPAATLVASQIILEKQSVDAFTNPRMAGLTAELGAERAVVYGVVTEICVRNAAAGLQRAGLRVEIVTDAVKELSPEAADSFFAAFASAGGILTTTELLAVAR